MKHNSVPPRLEELEAKIALTGGIGPPPPPSPTSLFYFPANQAIKHDIFIKSVGADVVVIDNGVQAMSVTNPTSIEVHGGDHDDLLVNQTLFPAWLAGDNGNDLVIGGQGGGDTLMGNAGNDLLWASGIHNVINGGSGNNDTLVGNLGKGNTLSNTTSHGPLIFAIEAVVWELTRH